MSPRRARTAIRAIPAEPAVTRLLTRGRSCALVLGVAAAAAVAVPASAFASAGASTVVGHVYVNDNTTGTNTIGAFDRHADGSLTPEAGSPFVAGGAGTGSGPAVRVQRPQHCHRQRHRLGVHRRTGRHALTGRGLPVRR